ncbi:MAG TPA: Uma2 family endonuclease [Candidatus Hypogeohydataceae bacterium YC38]
MSRPNLQIKFTYEDYKNLPESETKRYELLEGELVIVPSPTEPHQKVSMKLVLILGQFVQEKRLGIVYFAPLDVVLSQEDVVQPDIIFISKARAKIITEENIKGAPDLVIEITSPSTSERDSTLKHTLYARYGVKEYWIVDPKRKSVEVYTTGKTGFRLVKKHLSTETLHSPLLSDLEVPLKEVFS